MNVPCLKKDQEKYFNKNDLQEFEPYQTIECDIPTNTPYTIQQADDWSKIWPIQFFNTDIITVSLSEAEVNKVNEIMTKLLDSARFNYIRGNRFNSGALYDPQNNTILQLSNDDSRRQKNNINHCVMQLIHDFSTNLNACQNKPKQKINDDCKDQMSAKRKNSEDIENYFDQYFCLNLDLIIVEEPCIMCSMALIHSRIRRVYYCLPQPIRERGGLNQDLQINEMDSLNHKFQVFQVKRYDLQNLAIQND